MKINLVRPTASVWLAVIATTAFAQEQTEIKNSNTAFPEGQIATVNGAPIYFEDVERTLGELHAGAGEKIRAAPDLEKLLFRLVNDELLAQEARTLGMQDDEPIPAKLRQQRESLAVKKLEMQEVWSKAEPLEDQVTETFKDEYRTITFQILTVYEEELAHELLMELRDGADFEKLVAEHSVDQYSARQGLVEKVDKSDIPSSLAEELLSGDSGEVAGPFMTKTGWALVLVESINEADPSRFEGLEKHLRSILRLRNAEALKTDLGRRLRQAHPVVISDREVEGVVIERLPDGRLMPEVSDPQAVVATVGDKRTITAEDLRQAVALRLNGVANPDVAKATKPIVLERLIRDELLLAEALQRGYDDLPEVRRAEHSYETRLLVSKYLAEVLAAGIEPSQEEMHRYYTDHRQQYHRPPKLHIGQITVESEEEAQRLASLLLQGSDLAWLARQHSKDGYAKKGGDRGWMEAGRLNEFNLSSPELLFETQPGAVLGPVPIGDDYVILYVSAREDQGVYEYKEISGNVRTAAKNQIFERRLHETLQLLRSRSEIIINEEALDAMRITGAAAKKSGHGGA